MKCLNCGKETKLLNGQGEAYCHECMKIRRIKDTKSYSTAMKKYI
jgi:DNA-directed RNA polymerase subunit RPC12/RpoP